jgi:small GTP-binding protein
MEEKICDSLYKIVIIGETGTGKSHIIHRYLWKIFDPNIITTIGLDFFTVDIPIKSSLVRIQIWDTAGQEKYRAISSMYYRGAVGGLVVYDITNIETFHQAEKWITEFISHIPEYRPYLILVGNKSDLEDKRQVPSILGSKLAQTYGIGFIETSALSDLNVDLVFKKLVETIHHQFYRPSINHSLVDYTDINGSEDKSCCICL